MKKTYLLGIFLMLINCIYSYSKSLPINLQSELTGNSEVFGRLYRDVNNNGNFDSGIDVLLKNIDVIISSSTYTISVDTDNNGRWHVDNIPEGDLSVWIDPSDLEACYAQTEGVEIQNLTVTQNASVDAGDRGYYFELPESSCKNDVEILLSNAGGNSEGQLSVLDVVNDLSYCPQYASYNVSYTNNSGVIQNAILNDINDDEVINQDDLTASSFINFDCSDIGTITLIATLSIETFHVNSAVNCNVNAVVKDVTPPVLTTNFIDEIITQCPIQNETDLFTIMSEFGISRPTANDDCDEQILGFPNVTYPIISASTIEWTFTDNSDNIAADTLIQNINVYDTEPPVFDASTLESIVSSSTINSIIDLASLFPSGNLPSAEDNCDGIVPGFLLDASIFPIESDTEIEWIFTDSSGNTSSSSYNQSVSIIDNESLIVDIPDTNFKNALLNHNPVIDTNGDGEIQFSEAEGFSGIMDIDDKQISDLTGIEMFVNIEGLMCRDNQLTSLNLSNNSAITILLCQNNQLTSLDISNGNNSNLISFIINNNPELSCVNVDNQTLSRNWQKSQDFDWDDHVEFSEDCSTSNADGTVTDQDGNTYDYIAYGNQLWTTENAKMVTYRDGTPIPQVTNTNEWENLITGAWCYYNNDPAKGILYNWYAVMGIHDTDPNTPNKEFAPEGWHIPSYSDCINLENYLIANGYNYDGTTTINKIAKSMASTSGWISSSYREGIVGNDQTLNNSSGFDGFPVGRRSAGGSFSGEGASAFFWSSSVHNMYFSIGLSLNNNSYYSTRSHQLKGLGGAVRFIRDNNSTPIANNDTLILYQNETETLDVLANDTDEDGDTLTLVSASATHGTVSVVNGEISYTANAEDIEEDTVTYEVSDGIETVSGTVTVVYLEEKLNVGVDYHKALNNYGGFYNAPNVPISYANVALKNDSTAITWSSANNVGGDSSGKDLNNVKAIYSNNLAFAALKNDGTVVTWGRSDFGGDSSGIDLTNVKSIFSTDRAFTAIKNDGTAVSWGSASYGGDSSGVNMTNVFRIFSNKFAFKALKNDGTVVTWGDSRFGGDINGKELTQVKSIYSTIGAFAALRKDGTVEAWGSKSHGGRSIVEVKNVKNVFSIINYFAALTIEGDLFIFNYYGSAIRHNVKKVFTTKYAFAIIKNDNSVELFGRAEYGGDANGKDLSNIKQIFSNKFAFAALKNDGTVVTWGDSRYGGDSSGIDLTNVKSIFSTERDFAALKEDGTIVSWGGHFIDDINVTKNVNDIDFSDIRNVYSNSQSFVAVKNDGSVVTWGKLNGGADSSAVQDHLTNVVSVNMGIDYELTPTTTTDYVYNGTWSPSSPIGVSTANDTITIESGAVSFDQDVITDTVIVNPGASLSTAAGTTLTANTITLESSQNSFANFLNEGTVNAAVTYKRYVADEVSLDLVASPVSGQTFSDFASNNSNLFYQEGNASRKLFGHYDNTNRKYITYYDNDTRTIDLGTGYRAARLSSAEGNTLNFTGNVSNAQIEVPINTNGDAWNLVGNPYPTSISLLAFLTDNNTKTHDEYSGVYGYNGKSADKWDVWNLSYWIQNQSAVIAPAQGFFVKSKNASDNIVFKPSMRTTSAASNFNVNKTTTTNNGWFTVELNDGTTKVSTKVYLIEGTTAGLDVGYDAATFKAPNNDLAIYTTLVDGSSDNTFAVQSVGLDNLNTLTIPIGLNSSQGKQLQVRISDVQLPEGVEVYFNDATKVSSTLLNKGDYTYTTLADLEGTGRFSITFSNDALSNGNQTLEGLQVYSQDQQIALQGYLEANTGITLYDLQGRAVSVRATPRASQFNSIDASHLPNGVYVLEVQNTKGRFTQKLILN